MTITGRSRLLAKTLIRSASTMATTGLKDHYYFYRVGDTGGCFAQWYHSKFTAAANHFDYLRHSGNASFRLASQYDFVTAEQYMMFAKAFFFNDPDVANQIMKATRPREQKALGRKVQHFSEDRWVSVREEIVYQDNLLKFGQNAEIREVLLSTGNKTLVEASRDDAIWGIGFYEADAEQNIANWGLNLLGKALVRVRESLREEDAGLQA